MQEPWAVQAQCRSTRHPLTNLRQVVMSWNGLSDFWGLGPIQLTLHLVEIGAAFDFLRIRDKVTHIGGIIPYHIKIGRMALASLDESKAIGSVVLPLSIVGIWPGICLYQY